MYHRFSEVRQYLISVLGVPYYETEECILFCGDTRANSCLLMALCC